jgi:hypothetical protein
MKLLTEFRRRQVFKVGAAYAVVGWLLIQAASILFETFGAPAWVMQAFVTIVILGFPIALVLAWAFEISPDGVRRTRAATANEPIASTGSIVGYVVTATLAGAIGAGSFWMLSRDSRGRKAHRRRRLGSRIRSYLTGTGTDRRYRRLRVRRDLAAPVVDGND